MVRLVSRRCRFRFRFGSPLTSVQVSSVQDGIYALGKAHMRSTPFLGSFPNVACETVSMYGLTDNGPFSSFQRRSSGASSFPCPNEPELQSLENNAIFEFEFEFFSRPSLPGNRWCGFFSKAAVRGQSECEFVPPRCRSETLEWLTALPSLMHRSDSGGASVASPPGILVPAGQYLFGANLALSKV